MPPRPSVLEIFLVALRLGCTSFGGPVAHLAFFQQEYVVKRRWLDEAHFADLVALCQFLPGPSISQTGFSVGYLQRGLAGGLAAWLGFTLPSALLMIGFAYGVGSVGGLENAGWLKGLKVATVAVVAQAAMRGANAAVVGVLLAALYHPVGTAGLTDGRTVGLAVAGFVALQSGRVPAWTLVGAAAALGAGLL